MVEEIRDLVFLYRKLTHARYMLRQKNTFWETIKPLVWKPPTNFLSWGFLFVPDPCAIITVNQTPTNEEIARNVLYTNTDCSLRSFTLVDFVALRDFLFCDPLSIGINMKESLRKLHVEFENIWINVRI